MAPGPHIRVLSPRIIVTPSVSRDDNVCWAAAAAAVTQIHAGQSRDWRRGHVT